MSVQPDPVALTQRPLSAPDRPRSVAWSALIGALIVLALGASFFAWRVLTPSSCAWITADAGSWSSAGVVPRHTDGCPVPDGIAVTDVTRGAHDVAVAFADGSHATLPLTPTLPLAGERLLDGAWTLLFVVSLLALAAYAFVRQPSDRALGAALVFSSGLASSLPTMLLGMPLAELNSMWWRVHFVANTQGLYSLLWGEALLFAILFPTPLVPRVARRAVRLSIATGPLVLWLCASALILLLMPMTAQRVQYVIRAESMISVLAILAIAAVILHRMVRMRLDGSDFVGRQQLLWLGGTSLSALAGALTLWIVPHALMGRPLLPDDLVGLPGMVMVFGFGVALLRIRLFEMESVLVRILVDTVVVLVSLLAMLAVARTVAVWLHWDTATFMVVGAIAVAVGAPILRSRTERGVNWIVYRDPQSPYHLLSRAAESLAGRDVDFTRVILDMGRALRLPLVTLTAGAVSASSGCDANVAPEAEAVVFRVDDADGALTAYTRGRGDRLTAEEHRLLSDLARQIGTALHQLELTAELRRSREQLVLAREEERRAMRRVMHDDVAPTLAGIALQSETARRLVLQWPDSPERTLHVLDGIARDARVTSEALRDLSYELRPPALDDRGLVAAIEDVGVSLAPLQVIVDADGLGDLGRRPLPAAVEVAAFRITVEALRNAARHADATSCTVTMRRETGRCLVAVADDGGGIPAGAHAGVGVTSMRERAAELGGAVTIESLASGGTVVSLDLPVGGDDGDQGAPG